MNFRVYLWNLTVPYLYSPPLMQSSNKYNYALIFTYLKYSLCNSKKKNGYPICLSSCSSFFLVCFLIVLMNVFKTSWENLGGWVSKEFILTPCLFDRLACKSHFELQRFVLLLFSLQSGCWKYGCKLFCWFWT